ncbi:unnamed protein product [Cylindrotheca closterium]|uniref:Uncharacterized protein n=1 Tax=Cylindrotheca closterium TaxID=2856 RepID=A0AAD2FHR3_9STRA|nr:unnamed protein product [Cylindrotheca closterium]
MATTQNRMTMRQEQKPIPGILREVCTQSDWSLRLYRPGLGALLLMLPIIMNETWLMYNFICDTVPFFFREPKEDNFASNLKPEEWRRSHHACLKAMCRLANQIEFDCRVDETGESAYMLVVDDPSQEVPFDSEIPFPVDCVDTLDLMLGPENMEILGNHLRSSDLFDADTIDFIHYHDNNNNDVQSETTDSGAQKKKALFQLLPGQCGIWDILQQSWYEWHGDSNIDPPPPVPLVNFDNTEPGQLVRIKAREYLCYEEYIPKEAKNNPKYWISAYETVLKYRWYISFCAAIISSAFVEIMGLFVIMVRVLPLTICFAKFTTTVDPDPNYKMLRTMMEMWRIWTHLIGIHAMAFAIRGSEQVYVVCALATASMLLYGNTKASMEWTFLHIVSYGMEWEADAVAASNLILPSIEDALDLFIPAPGLCLKAIVVYMLYMSSSRILNKQ